ncbi:sodium channel protein Nach-like [Copidosoma floridanum]|uniref:sodium channel protein Nach-like n=1 Tax=Copidosoma floridanum TaxID=29053 RepID=UPI0006C9B909|nr:sodium channel protein Nach-like [Copidosoma floridanum]
MWGEIPSVSGRVAKHETAKWQSNKSVGQNRARLAWLAAPGEPRTRRTLAQLLWEQLKDYLNNSSLAGYKYMVEARRTPYERIMWVVLHVVMMITLCLIVWDVLQDYRHTPVVTIVDSYHYPSSFLDWPAVSLCSINRISKKATERLAERIKSSNATDLPLDRIVSLLYNLGYLYETSFGEYNKSQDEELDALLKKYLNDNYDLTQLMKELTPQCNDILIKCRFRFEARRCSELFTFRKTQDGFCCTFNYARPIDDVHGPVIENHVNGTYKIKRLGQMNGLTFLLDPFLDDYFFSILPISGWKITIFNSGDYPDNTSGGVSDALISPGTENFLELNAVSFYSEKSVRSFEVNERKCIFNDEIPALYDGYTYSDCIVDCKVNDIWTTCGCRPFYFPERFQHRVCNTSDIGCLNKFKTKWWSVLPHDIKQDGEESKIFNYISNESWSLRCKSCYPSCDDVHYYLQTSSVNLQKDEQISFLKDVQIVDQSLVHIYFAKYGTVRLKQDVAYYWYELLSNIGGICGVFIGFSLISAVEILYFALLTVSTLWRRGSNNKPASFAGESVPAKPVRTLYWAELAPRSKVNLDKSSRRRNVLR